MSNPDKAFDPTAFTSPSAGSVCYVGRNQFTGPSATTWDFALLKSFPFERRQVQFRAEFFNLFNRANFNLPTSNLLSSAAGIIGGTADPRLIQLGLRLDW